MVVVAKCRGLINQTPTKEINVFLRQNLKLQLHPNKIIIRKPNQGMDFLGYVVFTHHKLLRTRTKKRMFRKLKAKKVLLDQGGITKEFFEQSLQLYLGVLSHCKSYKIQKELQNIK